MQKEGGDGYVMSTVDGKPYWTDAIGQVPFAVDTYKRQLKSSGSAETAKNNTIWYGGIGAEGSIGSAMKRFVTFNPGTTNSYDNQMIKKTLDWAQEKYIPKHNGKTLDTTLHAPSKLFDYEIEPR